MALLTSNVHAMRGRTDVAHIPPMPLWVAIIRIVQLVLAIIILALTAYASSVFKVTFAGYGLAWFTFIWTLLFLAYIFVSSAAIPTIYHMFIHLGLEIMTTLWWLVTWAVLASESSSLNYYESFDYGYGYTYGYTYLPSNWKSAIDCTKASAGLGALEWVLFIITLVMFALSLRTHRLSHGPATSAAVAPGMPVTEEHKMQSVPVQEQHFQQQQMA